MHLSEWLHFSWKIENSFETSCRIFSFILLRCFFMCHDEMITTKEKFYVFFSSWSSKGKLKNSFSFAMSSSWRWSEVDTHEKFPFSSFFPFHRLVSICLGAWQKVASSQKFHFHAVDEEENIFPFSRWKFVSHTQTLKIISHNNIWNVQYLQYLWYSAIDIFGSIMET